MTLDEAIKYVEEVAEDKERNAGWFYDKESASYKRKCIKCVERQLAEWLKELKQLREQTRWISISESLPEKSGNYWCTFGGTNLTGSDYYTTESDAKKLFDDPEECIGWRSQNVVAWMPIPQPYKAESESKK